jgi:hypothetical protein
MGSYDRAARHKRLNDMDRYDGRDPQIEQWLVPLCIDPPDPASDYDESADDGLDIPDNLKRVVS